MKIINIEVSLQNGQVLVHLKVLGPVGVFYDPHFFFEDFEAFTIKQSALLRGERQDYSKTLRYALALAKLKGEIKPSIQVQPRTRTVDFQLIPDIQVIMGFLAAFSVYLHAYRLSLEKVSFESGDAFHEKLRLNTLTTVSSHGAIIFRIIDKIIQFTPEMQALGYYSLITDLKAHKQYYLSLAYNPLFIFLDSLNYETKFDQLYANCNKLVHFMTRSKGEVVSLGLVEQILLSLSKKESDIMAIIFDFDGFFKKKLGKFLQSNLDNCSAELTWLKQTNFVLTQDGNIQLKNVYKVEEPLQRLAAYLHWSFRKPHNDSQEIQFTKTTTAIIIQQGFMNALLFQALFNAYYLGDWLTKSQTIEQIKMNDALLNLLPNDILPGFSANGLWFF